MNTVAIVGAGLMGRLLALELAINGWQVTLLDKGNRQGQSSCGYTGAGMLAPYSELEMAESIVSRLGLWSLTLWPEILEELDRPVFFQNAGTLVLAHASDRIEQERFKQTLSQKLLEHDGFDKQSLEQVSSERLHELEPYIASRFQDALYLRHEGQVDNRQLFRALTQTLRRCDIRWLSYTNVPRVQSRTLEIRGQRETFDWVIDCRGLGAKLDVVGLRAVRGEIVHLYAPEVVLNRPIRLMHPRYPLYIAPRENHRFVVGATSIESDVDKPMSLQSAMELLSAAYTVHTGFAEASILEMSANLRPAYINNSPKLHVQPGLIRINGLYRHGFLIAPALMKLALEYMDTQQVQSEFTGIVEEEALHAACG